MNFPFAARAALLALVLLCLTNTLRAAISTNGALDATFDARMFDGGTVDAAALQPDGKVLITGPFKKV